MTSFSRDGTPAPAVTASVSCRPQPLGVRQILVERARDPRTPVLHRLGVRIQVGEQEPAGDLASHRDETDSGRIESQCLRGTRSGERVQMLTSVPSNAG